MLRQFNKYQNSSMMLFNMHSNALLTKTPMMSYRKMEDRKEDKEKKAFQEDIQFFLSKEHFTLYDFHERVIVRSNYRSP
jgi:hypothetical protein